MGSLRQDLLDAARAAVSEDLFTLPPYCGHARRYGVVLGGSAVTDDADEYSGCDLFVFRLARERSAGSQELIWHTVRNSAHVYRYAELSLSAFLEAAAGGEDLALHLLRHGQILHDPGGRVQRSWEDAWKGIAEIWPRKLAERYRAFRQRRASLAWSLRRGQPLQVMDNLRQLLEHALCCAYYLEAEPAPPRQWLFRGGLRLSAGRTLREPALELLSSLGDLATLGGSLNLNHNRIYRQVGRLQKALEQALSGAGYPVPGLASRGLLPNAGGPGWIESVGRAEPRTPRARSGRRSRRVEAVGAADSTTVRDG